jgi:hypothetical protein
MVRTTWLALLLGMATALAGVPAYGGEDVVLPPSGVSFDYQLGGDRSVPDHVGIVVRDRAGAPEPGVYNVCYVNGFQTQPGEKRFWRKRWGLVLKKDGEPVVDGAWGEWLLDVRTAEKRRRLARIVGGWTAACAEDDFDAVELDNLDSFSRSRQLITRQDARRFARTLVTKAHDVGLAAGQKNWAGWDGTDVGYDFAISEDCARWRECGAYVEDYGALVLDVEYRPKPFRRACRNWSDEISVVRRDLALTPDGLRRWCA